MAIKRSELRGLLAEARDQIAPDGYSAASKDCQRLWDALDEVDSEIWFIVTALGQSDDGPALRSFDREEGGRGIGRRVRRWIGRGKGRA